ncbi:MAG: glycerophosphodiester phosphodiesterase family protein [Lachnotalea sp.]
MLILIKNTWKIIKNNFEELLIFLLVYHGASIIIIYNFFSSSMDFALKRAGYSYLTAENIISFIKNPTSILLIIANILIVLIFMEFEIICLLENYRAANYNVKLKAYKIFIVGIFKTGRIIKKGNIINVMAGLTVLPFICLHFIVQELSSVKVINYLAQNIYESFKYKDILYLLILIILVASLLAAFVIPYVIFGEKNAKDALSNSFYMVRSKANKTWLYLIEWNVLLSVLIILIHVIAVVAAVFIISIIYSSDVAIANLLAVCDWIRVIVGLLSNIIGIAGNFAFIYCIYSFYGLSDYNEERDELNIYYAITNLKLKRMTLVISLLMVCVEIVYSCQLIGNSTEVAKDMFVTTQITAHRGGASYAPENTIAAISASVEVKADYAEIDVQVTKDGVVVLLHDSSLKRTTGYNKYIWEVNYDKVATLDAGSKFGKEFAGEKIPTLDEVLKFCKGKMNLNIEIKNNKHNANIAQNVMKVIEDNNATEHCVITSMDYSLLGDIKEINPDIKTGYILKIAYGDFENKVNADFLSIKHTYATNKVIAAAHNCGKEVYVWTVNSRSDIERMKLLEVDNIITDRPVTVREIYASEKSSRGFLELLKLVTKLKFND